MPRDQRAFPFQGMLIPGGIHSLNDIHDKSVAARKKQEWRKKQMSGTHNDQETLSRHIARVWQWNKNNVWKVSCAIARDTVGVVRYCM